MLPIQSISVAVGGASKTREGRFEKRGYSRRSWRGRRVELRRRNRSCGDAKRTEAQEAGLSGVTTVERVGWVVVM